MCFNVLYHNLLNLFISLYFLPQRDAIARMNFTFRINLHRCNKIRKRNYIRDNILIHVNTRIRAWNRESIVDVPHISQARNRADRYYLCAEAKSLGGRVRGHEYETSANEPNYSDDEVDSSRLGKLDRARSRAIFRRLPLFAIARSGSLAARVYRVCDARGNDVDNACVHWLDTRGARRALGVYAPSIHKVTTYIRRSEM